MLGAHVALCTSLGGSIELLGRVGVDTKLLGALGVVLDLARVIDLVVLVAGRRLALELDVVGAALGFGGGLLLGLSGLCLIGLVGELLGALVLGLGLVVIVVGVGMGTAGPEVPASRDGCGDGANGPVRDNVKRRTQCGCRADGAYHGTSLLGSACPPWPLA